MAGFRQVRPRWAEGGFSQLDRPVRDAAQRPDTGDVGQPVADVPVPNAPAGAGATVQALLAALRDSGLQPHPYGEDRDSQTVAWLARALRQQRTPTTSDEMFTELPPGRSRQSEWSRSTPAPASPDALQGVFGAGETAPVRRSRLGVAQAQLACPTHPEYAERNEQSGSVVEIIGDMSDMGAGIFRRGFQTDLSWAALFPDADAVGKQVPAPTELQADLRADGYTALARFTVWLIASRLAGTTVSGTLFNLGGGGPLNSLSIGDDSKVIPGSGTKGDPGGVTYGQVKSGSPAQQLQVWLSSGRGWSRFYWHPSQVGHTGTADQLIYQRFALNVWPHLEDNYMEECARRKALALAAYAEVIGEYLAHHQQRVVVGARGEGVGHAAVAGGVQ